jgi:hypothetical protein
MPLNDVSIDIRKEAGLGTRAFTGNLTVRRPHRLIQRAPIIDIAEYPPWSPCPLCHAYWTQID